MIHGLFPEGGNGIVPETIQLRFDRRIQFFLEPVGQERKLHEEQRLVNVFFQPLEQEFCPFKLMKGKTFVQLPQESFFTPVEYRMNGIHHLPLQSSLYGTGPGEGPGCSCFVNAN